MAVLPLTVDPQPRFDLSPYLYMQFMEPLGVTDGSVAAAWDDMRDRWREDVVDVTRELAPPLIRWGGCFSSYYRWKEAVGPRDQRRPMHNLLWGGVESNQVGTHELVDFCGTRWMVNAVMIPVPTGRAFMMPVARVMSLYRHHVGRQAVEVADVPDGLDVTASRTEDTVYLHVVNTLRARGITAQLGVTGRTVRAGTVFEIAADPELEILPDNGDALAPVCKDLPGGAQWTFPAASVSAVELALQPNA